MYDFNFIIRITKKKKTKSLNVVNNHKDRRFLVFYQDQSIMSQHFVS